METKWKHQYHKPEIQHTLMHTNYTQFFYYSIKGL